ncbi:MAG: alpha/beta hydrolase [Bacteroidota bacterium]
MKTSKTIVFIHGLFVNNTSWSQWKTYFEAKGFTVHTPANPGHEGNPSSLRDSIHPQLTQTGFEDVVNNAIKLIDTLPEKPIVVGHSLAGLAVMKLIELNKAIAGISIDGAPPKNVFAPLATIRVVLPVVNPFKVSSAFMGSKEWYHHAFFNNYSKAESDRFFEEIAVPESRKIARDTLLTSFANIDFKRQHQPLLFIGGEKDNIFSAQFTKKIADSYKDKNSVVDYKSFEGRSHFICGEKSWEEVAEYVYNWIRKL